MIKYILILAMLAYLILLTSCTKVKQVECVENKFKAGQKVIVSVGFYSNCEGIITELYDMCSRFTNLEQHNYTVRNIVCNEVYVSEGQVFDENSLTLSTKR